jgi:hypothetical protein
MGQASLDLGAHNGLKGGGHVEQLLPSGFTLQRFVLLEKACLTTIVQNEK